MRDRAWAGATGAVAVAAFLPAAAGGFVYDDRRFYAENPNLTHASVLWRAFFDPACQTADGAEAGLWRPLRTLSFALDRLLFGASAVGPHLVNAMLHGVATACVFALLRRFGASTTAALLGAAAYALHPAQVECVAWISSRGDLLAAALTWGSLLLMLGGRTGLALAAGVGALLAKEQAVVWPALACVAARLAGDDVRAAIRRALVPAAIVAAYFVARWAILAEPTQQGGLGVGPARGPQMAAMLGHQTWSALVPVGALFDWQMPPGLCPWPVALVACAALAAAFLRPTRLPALWFLAALVPTLFLQAFVPLNILVADRFLLFALPALAIVVARGVSMAGPAPAVAAALCFGALTETSIPTWRSDDALWGETARREPSHWRANYWLGEQALAAKRYDVALERFRAAAQSGDDAASWCMYAQSLERASFVERDAQKTAAAREAYVRAGLLFANPRAENRAVLLPTAELGVGELTLVLGDKERAAASLRLLVATASPEIPERFAAAFKARVERVAAAVEEHLGDKVLAARLREWGRLK